MNATINYQVGDSDERPWGRWQVLATGTGFAIKKIAVNPGERLSLQDHQHRSEHWIVLRGQAEVTLGDETLRLDANGTVFIPPQTRHRIHNVGQEVLEFIEVQTGETLDEADIRRYQDRYGRV
ncbi:MAG: phosphomannose isomerase type II C-terminal cupin domain [Cellvibrionales bacterium]|nr:phosphomannose isomerase type II C-terminal cupin domain [Cellvibrionales bacterium]